MRQGVIKPRGGTDPCAPSCQRGNHPLLYPDAAKRASPPASKQPVKKSPPPGKPPKAARPCSFGKNGLFLRGNNKQRRAAFGFLPLPAGRNSFFVPLQRAARGKVLCSGGGAAETAASHVREPSSSREHHGYTQSRNHARRILPARGGEGKRPEPFPLLPVRQLHGRLSLRS